MNRNLKPRACALAAALPVSACGGGDQATDPTPPTVTISAAAGPVPAGFATDSLQVDYVRVYQR